MLQPPYSPQDFQKLLDELVAETRMALRKHYAANGMTAPPRSVTVRQSGGITFHASPQLAEAERQTAKKVVPPGVNFTEKPRVSGALRDRYLNHLHDLCGQEYIDFAEMEARTDAMMLANTEDELQFLIHDLPPLPAEVVPVKQEKTLRKQRAEAVESTGYAALTTVMYAGALPAHSVMGEVVRIILATVAVLLWMSAVSKWRLYNKRKSTEKE